MNTLFIGVDPGQRGALACLDIGGHLVGLSVMPEDGRALASVVLPWLTDAKATACVELVGAMPGQGVSSMFTFGSGVGGVIWALEALGVVVTRMPPRSWQKQLGVALRSPLKLPDTASPEELAAAKAGRKSAVKASACEYVARRFPAVSLIRPHCRVPHDGLVDALCIAEAHRLLTGEINRLACMQ